MRIQWFGQSAFLLSDGDKAVMIDPFGSVEALTRRGMRWDYPALHDISADLLLVTHEHMDHNGVSAMSGDPQVIRSTAGTFDSLFDKVTAIASEHDAVAGTQRGPNTIFVFSFAGLRVCHFGDFGQTGLRPEQRQAIGEVDLLFLPVGGSATIGAPVAAEIVRNLAPRWTVPMHYRTPAISFLEPIDAFLEAVSDLPIHTLSGSDFATSDLPESGPSLVVPRAPMIG